MSALYDFKTKLMVDLGKLHRTTYRPDQIVLGEPQTPPFATAYDTLLDVMIDDVSYPQLYNRYPLSTLFQGFSAAVIALTVPIELTTVHEIIPYLNQKFSCGFTTRDLINDTLVYGNGNQTIRAAGTSYAFSGSMSFQIVHGVLADVPAAVHYWPMYNSTVDKGTQPTPLASNFDFVQYAGRMYAAVKDGGASAALGVSLPTNTDYTVEFQFSPNGAEPILFNNIVGQTVGDVIITDDNRIAMFGTAQSQLSPVLDNNNVYMITITKRGTLTSLYVNGVLAFTCQNVNAQSFDYWGGYRFNEFKYWNVGLEEKHVTVLRSNDIILPQPQHEFLFDGSGANTGLSALPANPSIVPVTLNGKNYGQVPGKTPFGTGISIDATRGGVIDIRLVLPSIPQYITLLSIGGGHDVTGNWKLYNGRLYYAWLGGGRGAALVANRECRITVNYTGTRAKYYLDGVLQSDDAWSTFHAPFTNFGSSGGDTLANIKIRAFRFFNRTLNDEEMDTLLKAM